MVKLLLANIPVVNALIAFVAWKSYAFEKWQYFFSVDSIELKLDASGHKLHLF